jgi:hypothetical protein
VLENEDGVDGPQSTPKNLTSLPRRFISGGAAGVGRLLSRARVQHLRLFFPRLDLLLPRWPLADGGRTRVLIVRTAIAEHLAAPVLLYISMAIFLACMLWLLFYS